jgi:hypothetical protein
MAITLSEAAEEAAVNAACNAIVDLLDAGSGSGYIELQLDDGSTEVATCVGQKPFFGAAADGVATQSGSAVDSDATGSASAVTKFAACDSDDNTVWSGSVAESDADLNIDDGTEGSGVIIEEGAVVTLSSIQFTVALA